MDFLKKIDFKSKQTKTALSFVVPFIVSFILSPGVFFEINTSGTSKENKIKYSTAAIHSFIFGIILSLFYYFYLLKNNVYT